MAMLRENCPRCKTQNSTFDLTAQNSRGIVAHDWVERFEIFSICRHCSRSVIFVVDNKIYDIRVSIKDPNGIIKIQNYINDFVVVYSFVSLKDQDVDPAPEFTPQTIADAFVEAETCVTVQCWNAAGAMFRTAIDLATKSLLPGEEEGKGPPSKVRRSLGLRLEWMFENGLLAPELKDLAEAVHQDGNDGVHDATLTKEDVLDLQDFTQQLLTRLYTVPGRIQAAKERRDARRATG